MAEATPYAPFGGVILGRVTRETAQSIPNNAETIIVFNTEAFDNDDMIDLAIINNAIVIKTPGNYIALGEIFWHFGAETGKRETIIEQLRDGGLAGRAGASAPSIGGFITSQATLVIIGAQKNDQMRLKGYQNSGGALNADKASLNVFRV